MLQRISILGAVLGAVLWLAAPAAEAGHRYRFLDASFRLGDVRIDIGYDSDRGRTLFLRTVHDFYEHPKYRCGSACRRVGRHVHHDYGCPRLGRFFRGYGYRTIDVIPPRIVARFLDDHYDDYDRGYRTRGRYYRDRHYDDDDYRYRRRHRDYDDDDYGCAKRRWYEEDD